MFILRCTVTPIQTEAVINYQWLKDNQPIQDETMDTLSFDNLTLKDAADYTCEVVTDSNNTTTVYNHNQPIQDETMDTLSFDNLTLKDAADYTCEVVTDSNNTTTVYNHKPL